MTEAWFNMEMILTDQQDHTATRPAGSKTLIPSGIRTRTGSICQMLSGEFSNITFCSEGTCLSQTPMLIYLFI